jgi:16S rRNA processing protein RimM
MAAKGSPELPDFPLRVGRVARAHALRGEVVLQLLRRREHAADLKSLALRRLARPLDVELEHPDETLERHRVTHVRWLDPVRAVLRLEGVEDRDAAEALQGAYLDVDPERLAPELCDAVDACFGARVLDADAGDHLGWVGAIRDNGAQALLEIELDGGGEALVPVVPELVTETGVDEEGRFVRVRPLPGLLEVNR